MTKHHLGSFAGFREVLAMLDGGLPENNLAEEIKKNTRSLAKKQRTWLRTQLPAHETIFLDAKTDSVGAIHLPFEND